MSRAFRNDKVYARSSIEAKENVSRVQRDSTSQCSNNGEACRGTIFQRSIPTEKALKLRHAFIGRVSQSSKSLNHTSFEGIVWVFRQGSAPGIANATAVLGNECTEFRRDV